MTTTSETIDLGHLDKDFDSHQVVSCQSCQQDFFQDGDIAFYGECVDYDRLDTGYDTQLIELPQIGDLLTSGLDFEVLESEWTDDDQINYFDTKTDRRYKFVFCFSCPHCSQQYQFGAGQRYIRSHPTETSNQLGQFLKQQGKQLIGQKFKLDFKYGNTDFSFKHRGCPEEVWAGSLEDAWLTLLESDNLEEGLSFYSK